MVIKSPTGHNSMMQQLRGILAHPSFCPTALTLFAAFHLLALGIRLHELLLSSEFIVIAAACRSLPLLPISHHIRLLRILISVGLNFLSAISAFAAIDVHTWQQLFDGLRKDWVPVVVLGLFCLAAEAVAEARHNSRSRTILALGVQVLREGQEKLFELPLENPSRAVLNLRIASHWTTPRYTAELRDTNNSVTLFRFNCNADLATCELSLEKGRYLIAVKKLDMLASPIRVMAHAIVATLVASDPRPIKVPASRDDLSSSTKSPLSRNLVVSTSQNWNREVKVHTALRRRLPNEIGSDEVVLGTIPDHVVTVRTRGNEQDGIYG